MSARPPYRRAITLAGLWLTITGALVLAPGCYGKNCEGAVATFGDNPGEGTMVDDSTWQSNPWSGPWLPFPRQQFYIFDLRALGGREPELVLPYISGASDPSKGGSFTLGGGNLTSVSGVGANRVEIKNDSCSDFFLRLVVTAPPLPPVVVPDAGTPNLDLADASVTTPDAGDAGDGGP